jgi:hypothetical protein
MAETAMSQWNGDAEHYRPFAARLNRHFRSIEISFRWGTSAAAAAVDGEKPSPPAGMSRLSRGAAGQEISVSFAPEVPMARSRLMSVAFHVVDLTLFLGAAAAIAVGMVKLQ